jgi:hypothetical protein
MALGNIKYEPSGFAQMELGEARYVGRRFILPMTIARSILILSL